MVPELRLPAAPAPGEPVRALVVDTNVALDLLVFADPGVAALRTLLQAGRLRWIATGPMRDELACVLAYPHIAARLAAAGLAAPGVLAAFDAQVQPVPEAPRASCVCRDADDQKFIDLAAAHAAVLLSKDGAVLRLRRRLQQFYGAHVAASVGWEAPAAA